VNQGVGHLVCQARPVARGDLLLDVLIDPNHLTDLR
jgi:hypothetical protein